METENEKKVLKLSEELRNYSEIRQLNKDQESSDKYFYELLDLVEFKLVDTLDISEINKINEFFNEMIIEPDKKLILR